MGSVCPSPITSIHTHTPYYLLHDQISQYQCVRLLKSNTYGFISNGEASFQLWVSSDFNNKLENLSPSLFDSQEH